MKPKLASLLGKSGIARRLLAMRSKLPHASTHRVLHTLCSDTLARELRGSRERLEDVLGERVRAISYPVGRPLPTDPRLREAARDAGYELGFSSCTGVIHSSGFDPLDAHRLAADPATSPAQFQSMIALPYLTQ